MLNVGTKIVYLAVLRRFFYLLLLVLNGTSRFLIVLGAYLATNRVVALLAFRVAQEQAFVFIIFAYLSVKQIEFNSHIFFSTKAGVIMIPGWAVVTASPQRTTTAFTKDVCVTPTA